MAEYTINKGIGKPAEFKGLQSQYLFLFAGGLLSLFVLFVLLYLAGINQWICLAFGTTSSVLLVWGIFFLNGKYGEHGLMKLQANRNHPSFIINRKCVSALLRQKKVKYEK